MHIVFSKATAVGTDIVQTVREAGTFTRLVDVIDRTGLGDLLAADGLFTLFAPEDRAFASPSLHPLLAHPDILLEVLTYHIAPGAIPAEQVARRPRLQTYQGEDLSLSSHGTLRVDGARVLRADIEASNGLIHVIDRVLVPAEL